MRHSDYDRDDKIFIDGTEDIAKQIEEIPEGTKIVSFDTAGLWGSACITLQQEPRKNSQYLYWYAYKRHGKKVKKAYVGRFLTPEKLQNAWNKLVLGQLGAR